MDHLWETLGAAFIGALVPVLLAVIFRKPLAGMISNSSELEFEWGKLKFRLKGGDAERMLQALFHDMRSLVDQVPLVERQRVIGKVEGREGKIRVSDIYRDFERETDEHGYLRGLREAQMIRPVQGGQFLRDSALILKPFGRLMLQYQRKYILEDEPS
jgi:hypothetical protein